MKEVISSLRTTFRKEMHMKLDAMKTNGKQIEEGLVTFDQIYFFRYIKCE
jgi:hypothetical protein